MNSKKHKRRQSKIVLYQRKIHNFVNKAHKKLATYLCQSYSMVLLPEFATSNIVLQAQKDQLLHGKKYAHLGTLPFLMMLAIQGVGLL